MSKNKLIAFIYNSQMPATEVKAKEIIDSLGIENVSWLSSAGNLSEYSENLKETSLVIVVGGDGGCAYFSLQIFGSLVQQAKSHIHKY